MLIATAGPIVNVFPRSPVVPFATLQGGVAASSPNADTFLLDSGAISDEEFRQAKSKLLA